MPATLFPAVPVAPVMDATAPDAAPRRPAVVLVASGLLALSAAVVIAGLLAMMWRSITDYTGASWLNAAIGLAPSDPLRVLPVIAQWLLAVSVAGVGVFNAVALVQGRRWSRWGALVCALGGLATLVISPWTAAGALPALLAFALTWTRPFAAFCDDWRRRRHSVRPTPSLAQEPVAYGPLPRYRQDPAR